jgi:DNA-binding XRE family transcriptional regulator
MVYPIRYTCLREHTRVKSGAGMEPAGLLERARRLAGLSRSELARRAGASRPTLAAYAAGVKSPSLATAEGSPGPPGSIWTWSRVRSSVRSRSAAAALSTFRRSSPGYPWTGRSAGSACLCA